MNVSAILTSDLHLREDTPVCRTDNFQKTLARKLEWLWELQHKHGDAPILDAGDLFHHWKPSPALLSWAMERLPQPFITVPGNHDIPQHNLGLLWQSGLNVLQVSGHIVIVDGYYTELPFDVYAIPWGIRIDQRTRGLSEKCPAMVRKDRRSVLLYHGMVYGSVPPYPGAEIEGMLDSALLSCFGDFDLILSGHYHQSFYLGISAGGPQLVNPGGIARMTADEIDRQPYVYLWDAERNVVEPVAVPIEQGVISRQHIEQKEQRSDRMDAFVSRMKQDMEIQLSFRENLRRYMTQNDISNTIQQEVWQCLEAQK